MTPSAVAVSGGAEGASGRVLDALAAPARRVARRCRSRRVRGRAPRRAPGLGRERPQAVPRRRRGRRLRDPRRRARSQGRRAREASTSAGSAARSIRRSACSTCATRWSTTASAAASTPTARARSTRSSCAGARPSSISGSCATRPFGCRRQPSRSAREAGSTTRRSPVPATSWPTTTGRAGSCAGPTRPASRRGTAFPLKRLGYSLADRPTALRAYRRVLGQKPENWQYVALAGPGRDADPRARLPGRS